MATTGVVQWGIDQLWAQLQKLKTLANQLTRDLNANKAELTALWSKTKLDPDATRRGHNQALLQPLIHQNSILRTQFLQPIVAKFNQAVAAANAALKGAGYSTPTLGDNGNRLGFAFVIAPAAAVVVVIAALALAATAVVLTQAQRQNTVSVAKLIGDPKTSPAQKVELLKAITEQQKAAADANQVGGFSFDTLVPILGLVAVILVAPSVMQMLPRGRAA